MHRMLHLQLRRHLVRGFTLVEIMVVVVIIGILGALVVPRLMGRTGESRVVAAKVDISALMQALKLYKLDNQRYPTTEQGLQALVTKPTTGPASNGWRAGGYLDKLPKDPWGNPYQYCHRGSTAKSMYSLLAPMASLGVRAKTPTLVLGIRKERPGLW